MFGSVEKAGEEQKNHMKKQYAVLGLGRFGYAVAVTLAQAGNQVLAVDSSEELVQEISDNVTYAVRAISRIPMCLRRWASAIWMW